MRIGHSLLTVVFLVGMASGQQPTQPQPAPTKTLAERLGHSPDARLLIIHADDIGMMHSVNRASIEALEKGWITSASILVPAPWFPELARWARANPQADLGIHLAVNSEWTPYRWGPVRSKSEVPSLIDAEGYLPLTEELALAQIRPADAEKEYRAQIERALAWGIKLTHFDSHMSTIPQSPELIAIYLKLGREYGLPVLNETASAPPEAGVGVDRILQIGPGVPPENWMKTYMDMLAPLPPGVYQLIVHLAYQDKEMEAATFDHPDWGAAWRQMDFDVVRNPEFQRFLKEQRFILTTWRELAKALPAEYKTGQKPATQAPGR